MPVEISLLSHSNRALRRFHIVTFGIGRSVDDDVRALTGTGLPPLLSIPMNRGTGFD